MSESVEISASLVKQLRATTGAGIMDCKKALKETEKDLEKAAEYLRIKGITKAESKTDRTVAEGLVESYVHSTGKIGVLLEINCETDFVARTDKFKELAGDIALQIAGVDPFPLFVHKEEVEKEIIDKERAIYTAQARETGKPEHIIEKIVEGKIEKFIKDICLLDQKFVKNQDLKISDLIKQSIAALGENITVKRFVRFQIGK